MAATSSESVENIGKPDGDENSFTVGRVRCQHQLFFGQRSSVYYCFWKEDGKTETEVVVKKIPQNHCTEKWEKAIAKHENKTINHDNILKMFGFEDEVDQWRYFALELYDATIEQFVTNRYKGRMPSDAQVLYQMAKGIKYLHDHDLKHGNINPRTILYSLIHNFKASWQENIDSNTTFIQAPSKPEVSSKTTGKTNSEAFSKTTSKTFGKPSSKAPSKAFNKASREDCSPRCKRLQKTCAQSV